MQSKAPTVEAYLASLPEDRRTVIAAIRRVILDNLDTGYEEGMQYGMIGYFVPHRVYPPGYHCDPSQPLPFAGLASQKNYLSIYLMGVYGEGEHAAWFREAWAKTGRKLDMGKCCVRFRKIGDVALEVIGEAIRRMPAKKWIEIYEKSRKNAEPRQAAGGKSEAKKTAKRSVKKKPARRS
ncbi:MAG: hypothetical protein CVU59_13465 [Deltaproteobacteria bacterium HGW-Deltaproteobacteria-17]|nr:MAG: hypothetical protein CVU59_13465 [Deltaproteobacteria bacterium HGW-Deltaproteobacteria-17]